MIFTTALIIGGMVISTSAAEIATVNNLNISVNNCNVVFDFSTDGKYSYDYDNTKFTVTNTTKDSTTEITINCKDNYDAKKAYMDTSNNVVFDLVYIYIPNQSYGTVTVINENAGVTLPELNSNINYTSNGDATNIALPGDYNKIINYTSVNGAGKIVLKESFNDFKISVKNLNSAVSLPKDFPSKTGSSTYEYTKGDGKAKINVDIQNCAFRIDKSSVEILTATVTATRNKALVRILHNKDKRDEVTLDAYNINDSNYFKLRDIAHILNRTNLNFNVEWNIAKNMVEVKSNTKYIDRGGEMSLNWDKLQSSNIVVNSFLTTISVDGKTYELNACNIDGNNYFKLRDLGNILGFKVDWVENDKVIQINTNIK